MKIKMNLDVIQDVQYDHANNTLRGYVCDPRPYSSIVRAPIVMERYYSGWLAYLRITLNGAIIFEGRADEEQMADFETLATFAHGMKAEKLRKERMDARDLAKAAKLFVEPDKLDRHCPKAR